MARPAGDRWQSIEALFNEALDREPGDRDSFLDRACADDPALRKEVQSLLDASGKTLNFLEKSVHDAALGLGEGRLAGQQIGAYRLIRVLGEGGMGMVYLAARADNAYQQQVAIKFMHAGFAQAERMLVRFNAERQILASLSHPNIARLLDGGVHDGLPYLVMEYVDGVPIDEYCKNQKLGTEARLRLFLTVCGAIEYAHKNLIVHRDIKVSNILVNAEGTPKLLDFGIAKLLAPDGAEIGKTRTAERMMTPEYASPEQLRGEAITTSTDVYALGVLLYELLSGKRPFQLHTTSPIEVVRVICEQMPELPSRGWKANPALAPADAQRKIGSELDNIVLMAMRKEPSRRYVSVGQLAEDVEAFLGGYPIRARTDTWGYRSGKLIRRHKIAAVAIAMASVALVAFSVAMALLARKAERARLGAERESQFLNSIFQSATPEQARGKQVTGRELLDAAAARVDGEFSAEPVLRATLLDNIGRAYVSLGEYGMAAEMLQRAYELRSQALGEFDLDTASTLDGLADAIRLQNDAQRAEPLFRKVLAIRQSKLPPADQRVTAGMTSLGECLFLEERNAEAESLLRRALGLQRQNHQDALVTETDNYLALVLESKGAYGEAAALLQESVGITKKIDGADSPNYANVLHNLAGTLIDAGDLSSAEKIDEEALAIRRKINAPGHPDIAYPLNNLGFMFLEQGDWASAEPLLKEALTIRGGPANQDVNAAATLNNWARMLQQKGEYAAAAQGFEQAIAIVHKLKGPESVPLAKMLANLGLLRADTGKLEEAEQLERQALVMRQKITGEESPDVASSLTNLALVFSLQHRPGEAEPLLRRALEIREKELSAGHPAISSAKVRLGEVLIDEGKFADAEALLRHALAEIHALPFSGPDWQVAEAELDLGAVLSATARQTEAAELLRNPEARLKSYPQAALGRQILARATRAARTREANHPSP